MDRQKIRRKSQQLTPARVYRRDDNIFYHAALERGFH